MRIKIFLSRYLTFVGIPYFIARHIEKSFWKYADPQLKKKVKKNLKEVPNFDKISEHNRNALDKHGGFINPVLLWVAKVIMSDFGVKMAIAGAVSIIIWQDSADNSASQLAKYGSAMLDVPGKRFVRLYDRIKGVNPQHSMDIREILFDSEITKEEKLVLLKIKIESALKNLKGAKRKEFTLFIITLILFSVNGNFVLFAWFMERLRALIGTGDDVDTIRAYIIEMYREYNAPRPQELAEVVLPEEIIKSITNID